MSQVWADGVFKSVFTLGGVFEDEMHEEIFNNAHNRVHTGRYTSTEIDKASSVSDDEKDRADIDKKPEAVHSRTESLIVSKKLGYDKSRYEVDENSRVTSGFGNFTFRKPGNFATEFRRIDDEERISGEITKFKDCINIVKVRNWYWLVKKKYGNVLNNYKCYWLNLYRPYDEYDIESSLVKNEYLYGCHCFEYCFRLTYQKREKLMHDLKTDENADADITGCRWIMTVFGWIGSCIKTCIMCVGKDNRNKEDVEVEVELEDKNYGNCKKKRKDSKCQKCKKRCCKGCKRTIGCMFDEICNIVLLLIFTGILGGLYYVDVSSVNEVGTNNDYGQSLNESSTTQQYGLCDTIWQDVDGKYPISAVDVTILSSIAYALYQDNEKDNVNISKMINVYFDNKYKIVSESKSEPAFFHMKAKNTSIHVDYIIVRGTQDFYDILQDLTLYVEISTFQILRWIFPFLTPLPNTFIRSLIYYASMTEGLINSEARSRFGDVVYNYTNNYLNKLDYETNLYIIGHSLGGAIAQVVGSRLYEKSGNNGYEYDHYISSYGVNSPGTLYSSGKFDFEMDSLQFTSVSLLTENDPVSMVDSHAGVVQTVQCNEDFSVECHRVRVPVCELATFCDNNAASHSEYLVKYCDGDAWADILY